MPGIGFTAKERDQRADKADQQNDEAAADRFDPRAFVEEVLAEAPLEAAFVLTPPMPLHFSPLRKKEEA